MATSRRIRRLLAVIACCVSAQALAAPGFIENARVSVDGSQSTLHVRFNCQAQYVRHEPQGASDYLRIHLEPSQICNGVSPAAASTKTRIRPLDADSANLVDLIYDGTSPIGAMLVVNFSTAMDFKVEMSGLTFELTVRMRESQAAQPQAAQEPRVLHRRAPAADMSTQTYAINLASYKREPTLVDAMGLQPAAGQRVYFSEVDIDGTTWYRLRVGDFASEDAASSALRDLRSQFPGAWLDTVTSADNIFEFEALDTPILAADSRAAAADLGPGSKVDELMEDARRTMIGGDSARAIQIYTKVLQMPPNARQQEAQEYLALGREKQGQFAHAKAEYQRYLDLYPDSEGAARVKQRLQAMLAINRRPAAAATPGGTDPGPVVRSNASDWRIMTYFSQYYRRDANQQNERDEFVSQSALYSDLNLDARRRGERFDLSSRLSAGYRSDFLDDDVGSGNDLRVSYAYVDLADSKTRLRGRAGRQSRNTGGVLGRFDGLSLGYTVADRLLLNGVLGTPAYSASDGVDSARSFYGLSMQYGPFLENLEVGAFVIQQDIEGVEDRRAVGGEFRYFGDTRSLWGLVDYDISYNQLGTAFLQGSWRLASKLSMHGSFDRRRNPFLMTGNAMIGQPVTEFAEMLELYPLDEIRQFALDRSAVSTSWAFGLSHSLSPRVQINADINETSVDATPESGGVAATTATSYRYYSGNAVLSSLFKEGDVTILGLRYSDSDSSRVMSLTADTRFPIGKHWRINPRLRVDRRERLSDDSDEWLLTPGIRLHYRRSQKFRVELEAGKQFSQRESSVIDIDRESYFLNIGYQVFF
ncbi:MAG: SPOR domain-containing protein [Woeseiaceae bacterium]